MLNQDGFFDETFYIQFLPTYLEQLFNEAGWETQAKFRVWHDVVGDGYRKKFSEVYLFSSMGTDGQRRNFGMFYGYGGKVTPSGAEPIISHNSYVGQLDEVEGSFGSKFKFKVFPIVPNSVILYDGNNQIIDHTLYYIDYEKGIVTFPAETPTQPLSATFALTDNAPDMPKRLWFFTFEDFFPERIVLKDEGLDESRLIDEMDGKFRFPLRAGERVKEGSVTLYDGSKPESGPINPSYYTVDYENGVVEFGENYQEPPLVYADYTVIITPNGKDYGDIHVPDFNVNNPKSLAGAAYSGLKLMFPSIPTAVSFIPDNEYDLGWGRNSQIYVWGSATKDRIVAYFRVDPAPNPEKAYFAPLYIGRLATIGKAPIYNNVLIGGSRPEDEIQYEPGLRLGRIVVDYGSNTSNGNSSVLLQQSVGGAMYQKHYLAFITHDVDIDTSRESRFNPSVYSGKYHISPMYIVHPSDGYVGRLDEVYAIHPKNISQLDELEVEERSENEHVGTGDGIKKRFHLFHKPVLDDDFKVQIVTDDGCVTYSQEDLGEVFTIDGKIIEFNYPPENNAEIVVTYNYKQLYRYTLADTPITPFQLANASPYTPIGLGFLKENLD